MDANRFVPQLESDFAKNLAEKARDAANFEVGDKTRKSGIQGMAEGRSDVYRLNPILIEIESGWNSRDFSHVENSAHVESLAYSIAAEGVKVPLTVAYKDSKVVLRDGECRLRAVWHAINTLGVEIATVPVIVENKFASEADSLIGQFIRNAGKPFSPIESGKHFSRLLNFMAIEEIARRVGQSQARVRQLLELHAAPEAIKLMVAAGTVSSTQALSTMQSCHGNAAMAVGALEKAVQAAQSEGRTRATGRHLADPVTRGVTAKKLVADILSAADIDEDLDIQKMVIKLSFEDWEKIRQALKL